MARLESLTGKEIDLILLNTVEERNPQLAYEIVFGGELLFSKEKEVLDRYRRRTLHYFFDTEPLRRMLREGLDRRLSEGTFAKFDHA